MPSPTAMGPAPDFILPNVNVLIEMEPLTEPLGLDTAAPVVVLVPIELEELELVEQPPELPLTPV